MFARYVVFVLLALAECAALGAPRFRMVLDLERKYGIPNLFVPNASGQYFGNDFDTSIGYLIPERPWFFNGVEKVPVGLFDREHTDSNGQQFNEYTGFGNAFAFQAGVAGGQAKRFTADGELAGQSAWIFRGGNAQKIGLAGAGPFGSDFEYHYVKSVNEFGWASGVSYDYSQGFAKSNAWFFDGQTTYRIGLESAEGNGVEIAYHNSPIGQLSKQPQVIGYSELYARNFGGYYGAEAWVYAEGKTTQIGLRDSRHVNRLGYPTNQPRNINAKGQVYGVAYQVDESQGNVGETAWFFDGQNTREIGLTGPSYTNLQGNSESSPQVFTAAGQAYGSSTRFDDRDPHGNTLWYFDGENTVPIGLNDAEHTRDDGSQGSSFAGGIYRSTQVELGDNSYLNAAGQIVGNTARYLGGSDFLGATPWIFDGKVTIPLGLTDAAHTRADGYRNSVATNLSDTGYVSGYTERFDGFNLNGRDLWIYDPERGETQAVQLPADLLSPNIHYLGNNGELIGSYKEPNRGVSPSLLARYFGIPFYYSLKDGFIDLNSLIVGGSDLMLNRAFPLSSVPDEHQQAGLIFGDQMFGSVNGVWGKVVLVPIPEPSTLPLAAVVLTLLFRRSQRSPD
jgi:hypothetical protein